LKHALCLCLLLTSLAFAESEIPVNIKAQKLKYSEETGLVTATGSVEIHLKEITILADELRLDTKTNIVTAEGRVKFQDPDYDGRGASLTYFVDDETSIFSDFKTRLSPNTISGNLYLNAEEIDNRKVNWTGREGGMTTCDYAENDNPHYYTAARRVTYYPGDKIEGWSVTQYIGRAPVMWLPYVVYDLKRKRKRNWSIGHNQVEGDFIKTFWDYPGGTLYVDEMEKKSLGLGFDRPYNLGGRGAGALSLYHISEADTHLEDWVTKWNHSVNVAPDTRLSLAHTSSNIYLIPYGRLDQSTYRLDLNHQKDGRRLSSYFDVLDNRYGAAERASFGLSHSYQGYDTNYNADLDQGKGGSRYIRWGQRLSHNQPLFSDKTRLSLNASYFDNLRAPGIPGDERLEPNLTITHVGTSYTISIYENWYMDLDRDQYTGDNTDQFVEKQPEITLRPNALDLKLFTLSPEFSYGWYREVRYVPDLLRNRDFKASRYRTTLNANKSLPLKLGSTLFLSAGIDQLLYEPGDALYAYRESAGLSTQGGEVMRNDCTFNRGISEGNSPFLFDQLGTKYSHIRDTLNFYYQSYFNWMITGGYNYETKKYFNVDTELSLNPHPALSLYERTGWDIESQRYLDLSSSATLRPIQKCQVDLSVVNDLNSGFIKSGNSLVGLEVGEEKDWLNHWQFKFGHVYNPYTQDFKLVDLMVVKDLHCWEVTYTYSDYRKEFALVFKLKALPEEPFGYNEGRGFYFEGFEKTLKEEFTSESPHRY